MSDFNDILAKHFAGETSAAEEAQVQAWKSDNAEEYQLMADMWNTTPDFDAHTYDNKFAWEMVDNQIQEPKEEAKIIRMKRIKLVATFAASIVLLIFGVNFLKGGFGSGMTEITNETSSVKEINLPDGTQVSLAPNSTLRYSKVFATNRDVELEGQAFFDVARDEEHPFVISTEMGEIEVLGTAFNIRCLDDGTVVSVEHGLVAVRNNGKEVKLKENETARTSTNGVSEVGSNDINYLSWKTGSFSFSETPLPKVVDELNQYYDTPIVLEGNDLKEIELTASFEKLPFEEVIDIIETTCGVDSEEADGEMILR